MTNIEEFRAETLPNRPDSFSAVLASSPATVPLHSIENLRWTKIAVSWGATSPDQPFHFIRFLTEAEAGAGQIQFPASASFQFLILEAE